MPLSREDLLAALLETNLTSIIPMTRRNVEKGCKIFGAAILRKSDLSLVIAETNNEIVSPLLHGEINCIQEFWAMDANTRPDPKDCIFYATHEPCSLWITWSGFDNFYYLFSYQDTKDTFDIPHDLKILKEVYQVPAEGESPEALASRPLYNQTNAFFSAHSVITMIDSLPDGEVRAGAERQVEEIKRVYDELSGSYQASKGGKGIPLA